jgi:hypothetical protein
MKASKIVNPARSTPFRAQYPNALLASSASETALNIKCALRFLAAADAAIADVFEMNDEQLTGRARLMQCVENAAATLVDHLTSEETRHGCALP